ncbi:hypothetical protein DID77_00780 [Candidatus Marinamargulisbacteria bacterium SCGC AG-439-L15]|nr:hypothetical protein DID77_00780 [Candidatus Marinamargulisbacteria bacterium SCGC AG-439-L15]
MHSLGSAGLSRWGENPDTMATEATGLVPLTSKERDELEHELAFGAPHIFGSQTATTTVLASAMDALPVTSISHEIFEAELGYTPATTQSQHYIPLIVPESPIEQAFFEQDNAGFPVFSIPVPEPDAPPTFEEYLGSLTKEKNAAPVTKKRVSPGVSKRKAAASSVAGKSVLPIDYKPVRGRGRQKQLERMSPEERAEESNLRREINCQSARVSRRKKKDRQENLEAIVIKKYSLDSELSSEERHRFLFSEFSKTYTVEKVKIANQSSVLPIDHRTARGRGRQRQLERMSPEERAEENSLKQKRGCESARRLRQKQKAYINWLEKQSKL